MVQGSVFMSTVEVLRRCSFTSVGPFGTVPFGVSPRQGSRSNGTKSSSHPFGTPDRPFPSTTRRCLPAGQTYS